MMVVSSFVVCLRLGQRQRRGTSRSGGLRAVGGLVCKLGDPLGYVDVICMYKYTYVYIILNHASYHFEAYLRVMMLRYL